MLPHPCCDNTDVLPHTFTSATGAPSQNVTTCRNSGCASRRVAGIMINRAGQLNSQFVVNSLPRCVSHNQPVQLVEDKPGVGS